MPVTAPQVPAPSRPEVAPTPVALWPILIVVAAVTSSAVGGVWDISWHMTIGRDTFWTPAHIAIYFGGAGAGFACGAMAIRMTFFGSAAERAGAVRLFGCRAPFGAWIAIWGALAMVAAGPFDNWWHNAYGLDVRIISPPHMVLFVGSFAIRLGAWLLLVREQNRSERPGAAAWLFCYLGVIIIEGFGVMRMTEFWPNRQHSAHFFYVTALDLPFGLVAIARASKLRWAATLAATGYMLLSALFTWILPLFAASPRLGPIYHPVTHMVPPPFPLWLIAPAVAIDLLQSRAARLRNGWDVILLAVVTGAAFVLLFFPVQWLFANYLLSPAGNNAVFAGGSRIWAYTYQNAQPYAFWDDTAGFSGRSIGRALAAASVSAWAGFWFGHWMTKVRR